MELTNRGTAAARNVPTDGNDGPDLPASAMKKTFAWVGAVLAVLVALSVIWWMSKPWLPYHDPHLAPGIQVRLLQGHVRRAGPLVFQMSLPPHFVFPTHFHDVDEELMIVSGPIYLGGMDGTPFDCGKGARFEPGAVHRLQAGVRHWGYTSDTPVVVEVRSQGPYTIHWVDTGPPRQCN